MEQNELVMALNGLAEILAQGNWVSIEDGLPDVDCENNQCKVTECVIAFSESEYMVGFFRIWKFDESWEFISIDEDNSAIKPIGWIPLDR